MAFKSPESVMRSALVGSTSVTSIMSTRIYPILAPASAALPFAVWRRSGIQRNQSLSGPQGIPRVSVEYSIYATTYEQARDAADAFRRALDGYGGSLENTSIEHASLENEVDDFVTLQGADMPPVYSVTQTYEVNWLEG
jgi:hypothetical protein